MKLFIDNAVLKKCFLLVIYFTLISIDVLGILHHWQFILPKVYASLPIILIVYYFFERKGFKHPVDVAIFLYLIVASISDVFFYISPLDLKPHLSLGLALKFALLIFILLNEQTFYIQNKRQFLIISLSFIIISLPFAFIFNNDYANPWICFLVTCEAALIGSLVIYKDNNDSKFPFGFYGYLLILAALVISVSSVHNCSVGANLLFRLAYSFGHLFIVFSILDSFL